jgi:hypothetical protein
VRLPTGLACLLVSLGAAGQERPDDFAYSVPLAISGDGALQQLDVPQPVYEGVTRVDLADVRVFNGRGEIVPHALKPRPAPGTAPAAWVELPFFPLQGARGTAAERLDIRAKRTPAGTIVQITRDKVGQGAPALLGYLVDATGFERPIQALDLDWRDADEGMSGRLEVEASDDLQYWQTLVSAAPLVSLEFGGQRLVQKTVELPALRRKYLRLTWLGNQKPIELTRLRARPSDVLLEPPRQWKQVSLRAGEKAGELRFEAGGRIPVDRLRVALPERNTLVPVQILARHTDDQRWQLLTTGVVYRLTHEGRDVVNADLSVSASGWEQWLLRLDSRAGGIGAREPQVELGWVPRQLVFVARGEGPFQLAYGNVRARSGDLPIQTLVPGWRSDAELKAATATAGAQEVRAGPRALRGAPDYKTWGLWASLAIGVVVLAWMAWVLAREMRSSESKTTTGNGAAEGADERADAGRRT